MRLNLPIYRWATVIILIILIIFGAIPSYLQGKWSREEVPKVANINQIRNLLQTGLVIPRWTILQQEKVQIGNHEWLAQMLQSEAKEQIILFLLPQKHNQAKPEVEWVDINGFERWKSDSHQTLNIQLETENIEIKSRFFRAWNSQQTFAVVQWYAFPQGGNPAPATWFFADQMAQLHHHRVPWIAVCLKIPIEPLGDISKVESLAISISKSIQASLITNTFSRSQ